MTNETEKLMQVRDEYLTKAKEIEYKLREDSMPIVKDDSHINKFVELTLTELLNFEPHERRQIIEFLKSGVKESLSKRADVIEKELHYLKDVNQAL